MKEGNKVAVQVIYTGKKGFHVIRQEINVGLTIV